MICQPVDKLETMDPLLGLGSGFFLTIHLFTDSVLTNLQQKIINQKRKLKVYGAKSNTVHA